MWPCQHLPNSTMNCRNLEMSGLLCLFLQGLRLPGPISQVRFEVRSSWDPFGSYTSTPGWEAPGPSVSRTTSLFQGDLGLAPPAM